MRTLLAASLLIAASGQALSEGTYVRLELGRSELDLSGFDSANSESFGVTIGQQIIDNLSAELGYRSFDEFALDRRASAGTGPLNNLIPPGSSSPERLDLSLFEVGLNYRLVLEALNPKLYLEARAGLALFDTRSSQFTDRLGGLSALKENSSELYYGLGAGFRLTEQFDLGLNLTNYQVNTPIVVSVAGGGTPAVIGERDIDLPTLTFSASWRF